MTLEIHQMSVREIGQRLRDRVLTATEVLSLIHI